MYKVYCKSIMKSQFSDLISSHTYLFYLLKVIGHFTPIIVGGGPYLASLKHRNPVAYRNFTILLKTGHYSHRLYRSVARRQQATMKQFFSCTYCKSTGHFISHYLKRLTKNCSGICRDFNRFKKSHCDIDGSCIYNRLHICSLCNISNCKAYFHVKVDAAPPSTTGSHPAKRNQDLLTNIVGMMTSMKSTIENLKSTINQLMKRDPEPKHPTVVPEKTTPESLQPEIIDLIQISPSDSSFCLPIVSSGKRILMPISTSPLSATSLAHAVQIINNSKEPTKIQPLDSSKFHIDASKATPFKLYGTIIVPITFENNVTRNFQMLVLENLPNAIIFGENHLQKTEAEIFPSKRSIYFRHPNMNFELKWEEPSVKNTSILDLT